MAEATTRVTVRLFAGLREQAGTGSLHVDVATGSTVLDVYRAVGLAADVERVRPSVNRELCDWNTEVHSGDEVAFIPPVSGGRGKTTLIELTEEPLDARRLEAAVAHAGAGAICTFTGVVRDNSQGQTVTKLEYEAYPQMASEEMRKIADELTGRWPGARVAMAHRFGNLGIGEASVVVCVSAPHRAEAFEACRWGIDRLKESVPIWKKEFTPDGSHWIEGNLPSGAHDA